MLEFGTTTTEKDTQAAAFAFHKCCDFDSIDICRRCLLCIHFDISPNIDYISFSIIVHTGTVYSFTKTTQILDLVRKFF